MRVGIITLYNNNTNYGGIAQTYALQRYIEKLGYDCKIINYRRTTDTIFGAPSVSRTFLTKIKDKILWLTENGLTQRNKVAFMQRNTAMDCFRENHIFHTKEYTDETISGCVEDFDVFISGSDQIWKPQVIRGPFVLDFVPQNKAKISYASSISQNELSEEYGKFMRKYLYFYRFISVREKEAQEYLQHLLKRKVSWVVDPVLLLSKEEWDCIASARKIKGKYILGYFLGDSVWERREAQKYSKQKHLQLVTMPNLKGRWRFEDYRFGDIQIYDAGVEEFLSLIKNAEYIITDSFHAVVFSYIFQKEFFVFPRVDKNTNENMNTRISSFLELIDEPERLIVQKLDSDMKTIIYEDKINSPLEKKRVYSRDILSSILQSLSEEYI